MKKIFAIFVTIFMAFAMVSCKDVISGVVYNVNVDGNAKGDVVVTFPDGNLELNGEAGLLFNYSNDTTVVASNLLLEDAMKSTDKKTSKFANNLNNGFNVAMKEAGAEGSYHVRISGYAKEPKSGIVIAIDKTFDYPAPVDEVTE